LTVVVSVLQVVLSGDRLLLERALDAAWRIEAKVRALGRECG